MGAEPATVVEQRGDTVVLRSRAIGAAAFPRDRWTRITPARVGVALAACGGTALALAFQF